MTASAAPASAAAAADRAQVDDLVVANRILADQGVVDGFGHVSVRHERDPARFLLSRSMAPALVTAADIMTFDLTGEPIDGAGRTPYLERFIHSEIYRRRPDVMAVVHSHSPAVIPFGVTPVPLAPIFHMPAFLGGGVPVFEIRETTPASDLLIRTAALGAALAEKLGERPVALMRGHGSVAVGRSLKQVVYRAIYTEVNARLQSEALRLGPVTYLTDEEARLAAATNDSVIERPWQLWKARVTAEGGTPR